MQIITDLFFAAMLFSTLIVCTMGYLIMEIYWRFRK